MRQLVAAPACDVLRDGRRAARRRDDIPISDRGARVRRADPRSL